jgi:hypothetical protein
MNPGGRSRFFLSYPEFSVDESPASSEALHLLNTTLLSRWFTARRLLWNFGQSSRSFLLSLE